MTSMEADVDSEVKKNVIFTRGLIMNEYVNEQVSGYVPKVFSREIKKCFNIV